MQTVMEIIRPLRVATIPAFLWRKDETGRIRFNGHDKLGAAIVKGFQGSSDGTIAPGHVAATLKVLAGHGQPEGGLNQGPVDVPLLREHHHGNGP